MNAKFDQEGLDPGYARVTLVFENGDNAYVEGDSIAIGRPIGSDTWEFIAREGGQRWNGAPQPLKLAQKPETDGNQATFLLQPAYVDEMLDDGNYIVKLVGSDGREKNTADMSAWDVIWSGLDNTGALKDYSEEEARIAREKQEEEKRRQEAAAAAAARLKAEQEAARAEAERRAAEEAERKAREEAEAAERKAQEEAAALAAQKAREEADRLARENAEREAREKAEKAEAERLAREEAAKQEAENAARAAAAYQAREEAAKKSQEEAISERQPDMRREEADAQILLAQPEVNPPEKKSRGMLVAGIVLLILALAGGGFFYWNSHKSVPEAIPESTPPAPVAKAPEAAPGDTKSRVAAFFAGKRDPAAAMELAGQLEAKTPEQQDALFRLYYYAAEQDNPEGALRYAECLDPSRPAWGTIQKDGVEAWHNYGKSPDGEQHRQALKKWAREAAENGNADARSWLGVME